MPEKFFRLVTLGRLALCPLSTGADPGVDELNARRRKIVLLVVLALRKRPVSRDTLIEMFWGGQDEARARHSLSDAVSHLRRVLGRDAIVATRSELSLGANAPLVVDAVEFAELAADPAQRARAITMYGGRFLDGVYVSGSITFDNWLSREQARFERMFVKACELQCDALSKSGSADEWAAVAERWLDADPMSVAAALALMNALSATNPNEGDALAVAAFERLRSRLAREYEALPDVALVERARQSADAIRLRAMPVRVPPAHESTLSDERAPSERGAPHTSRTWRRRAGVVLAFALAFVAASAALDARRARGAPPPSRSVLAVAEIIPSGDTAARWLADGLPQMIAAELSRSSNVDVIPPSEVRAVRTRAEMGDAPLSISALHELGRRAGATVVLSGGFQRRSGVNLLELRLLDVRTAKTLRLDAVADSSLLSLVDRAVVRLLDAVGATSGQGPRLAEIETANLDAYQHFVRSFQLGYDHPADAITELDAAIALDSGFTSALVARHTQAIADNDMPTIAVLNAALQKRGSRVPERDRLEWESRVTFMAGDIERSEALAHLLVQRYPRDPRGYQILSTIYENVGRWEAQESILERLIALDSLGMEAGRGPCVSCFGLGNLTSVRMFRGDWSGAERAARRWTALTPEMHAAWTNLALAQAYAGHFTDGLPAARRALTLAPHEPSVSLTLAWVLLMSREYDATDSVIAEWERSHSRTLQMQAADVRVMLLRERGQFRAANATIQRAIAEFPDLMTLGLLRADGLVRIGACRDAIAAIELVDGSRGVTELPAPGGASRAFAWHHTHLADAIARSPGCGKTSQLEAIADSVERIGRRSYYGRDWTLHHHVRGLIAERRGDYATAEDELRRAQWRLADGWTRSLAELARVQLARGRAADAIASLRQAYAARPDAMGRYEPRSELDYLMALAFRSAGALDSASVYESFANRAWANADPEVKQLLRTLTVNH